MWRSLFPWWSSLVQVAWLEASTTTSEHRLGVAPAPQNTTVCSGSCTTTPIVHHVMRISTGFHRRVCLSTTRKYDWQSTLSQQSHWCISRLNGPVKEDVYGVQATQRGRYALSVDTCTHEPPQEQAPFGWLSLILLAPQQAPLAVMP